MGRHLWSQYLALGLLIAILAGLMLYPLLLEVGRAFIDKGQFSLIWVKSAFGNDLFRTQLLTSLALAGVVTILCNVIALPLAA